VRRFKPAAVNYVYRNIDVADFNQRLFSSRIFTEPVDTPDEYLEIIESSMTTILDVVAPIRHGARAIGDKPAKWLEPDAIAARQNCLQLERRWKKSCCEKDRVAYREACRKTDKLINASRNLHRYQCIAEAGRDTRRVWSAVKNLLYTNYQQATTSFTDEDASFCSTLAIFFLNKVQNIKKPSYQR
jgi:hypothetical protein